MTPRPSTSSSLRDFRLRPKSIRGMSSRSSKTAKKLSSLESGSASIVYLAHYPTAAAANAAAAAAKTAMQASPKLDERKAFDLFPPVPSREHGVVLPSPIIPEHAEIPLSPRTPVAAQPMTRLRSVTMTRSNAQSHLLHDQVFVIAPSASADTQDKSSEEILRVPSLTSSSNSGSNSSKPSSLDSDRNSSAIASWIDNMNICRADQIAIIESLDRLDAEVASISEYSQYSSKRSSLDDIEDQLYSDLLRSSILREPEVELESLGLMRRTRSEMGHSANPFSFPGLAPAMTSSASCQGHNNTSSKRNSMAPPSLGPLPPRPSTPSSVKGNTRRHGRFYSMDNNKALDEERPVPDAPKDVRRDLFIPRPCMSRKTSASSVVPIAIADLDKTSEVQSRRSSFSSDEDDDELETPSSRFSEDSVRKGGKHASLINFANFKTPSFASLHSVHSSSASARASKAGTQTPELMPTAAADLDMSRSSSVSSVTSDLLHDQVFDLSRPSIDYRQVYALATEYVQNYAATTVKELPTIQTNVSSPLRPRQRTYQQNKSLTSRFALPTPITMKKTSSTASDPKDRSYHLRRFA